MKKVSMNPNAGLYKNGRLWWVRTIRGPLSGAVVSRSTGSEVEKTARRVRDMVQDFAENRTQWDWLEKIVEGTAKLSDVYNHHSAGTLATLRAQLEAPAVADPDVEPHVEKWIDEHLASLVRGGKLSDKGVIDHERQIRALIPAGERFPRSKFTDDTMKAKLLTLTEKRSGEPLSSSSQRRYVGTWQLFYKYAKKRVPLTVNPFEDADWIPANGSPRMTFWDHATRLKVLAKLSGEARAAAALVLGSGIELGALLAMTGAHVSRNGERTVVAPGSKNEHREDRTIFVDEWAWRIFYEEHAKFTTPLAPLWTSLGDGGVLRDRFYEAQVAAGVLPEPPVSETSGKKLWGKVDPHTIHDARHTYCFNRVLGLDGERRQDLKFCSMQLGHANEQMVMQIYTKANLKQRLALIEERERIEAAVAAAKEGK